MSYLKHAKSYTYQNYWGKNLWLKIIWFNEPFCSHVVSGFVCLSFTKWCFLTVQDVNIGHGFYQPNIYCCCCFGICLSEIIIQSTSLLPRGNQTKARLSSLGPASCMKGYSVEGFWSGFVMRAQGTIYWLLLLGLLWAVSSASSLIHKDQRTPQKPWHLTVNYVYFGYNFLCLECPLLFYLFLNSIFRDMD